MLPTHECLDTERPPGEQPDLGLVVDDQLSGGNAVPQFHGLCSQIL
jgi:hypothetical protein